MLWGRSASRCALCKCELVMDASKIDDESLVGEACHIIARSSDGPRGNSDLPSEQRDKYPNLILLCNIHHKQVDDQPESFTADRLSQIKAEHEMWVREQLTVYDAAKQHDDEIYASYIDGWESRVSIDEWRMWTAGLLAPQPQMSVECRKQLDDVPRWLFTRIWPKRYPELEAAFVNFRLVLRDLLDTFFSNAEKEGDRYFAAKFYQGRNGWNSNYDADLIRYRDFLDLVYDLTLELVRAANLISDCARACISPSYGLDTGRFTAYQTDGLTFRESCPEYSGEERVPIPYPGLEEFKKIRHTRDYYFGEEAG